MLDLHAHSLERSLDSGVTAEVIAAQAAARGLDGICLTEHNSLWARCARGAERTARGHGDPGHGARHGRRSRPRVRPRPVLAGAALDRRPVRHRPIRRRGDGARSPHALDDGPRPGWAQIGEWFDALEAINGDDSAADGYFVRLAAELGHRGRRGQRCAQPSRGGTGGDGLSRARARCAGAGASAASRQRRARGSPARRHMTPNSSQSRRLLIVDFPVCKSLPSSGWAA